MRRYTGFADIYDGTGPGLKWDVEFYPGEAKRTNRTIPEAGCGTCRIPHFLRWELMWKVLRHPERCLEFCKKSPKKGSLTRDLKGEY